MDHNSRYGQPGALAYKLDSLFINRRIEETGRPVPKIIRLGSLREIAEEIGSGNNTGTVKQALLQNATASITAKISYRTHSDGERWLEAVFNRYSVVFTGEKLPHGKAADGGLSGAERHLSGNLEHGDFSPARLRLHEIAAAHRPALS